MADKIKKSDLFDEGLFDDAVKGAERLSKNIKELQEGVVELMTVTKNKIQVINPSEFKDIQELNKQLANANTLIKNKTKLDAEAIKIAKDAEKLKQEQIKTQKAVVDLITKEEKEIARVNKERQKATKEIKAQNSVYEQNKRQLKAVSDRYKELVSRGREGTTTGKLLKVEFERLDKSVRKAEQSVGQFNRNVGNYKNAVKDAFRETNIFNTGIGRLIVGLGELKKRFEENSKAGGGFGKALKIGVAGGIGVAIAALTALVSVNSSVAQGFEKIGAQLLGFVTGGFKGAAAATAFKEALFASFEALRNLGIELQKVTLDEQDFLDISNDTTIGFKERNAALEKSIQLSKQRADIALQAAQLELDVINKQVIAESIGLRSASPELLDKKAEAQKKVNEALDVQSDLLRENAQRERQLQTERTSQAIDLLLKQKQNGKK